MHSLSLLLIPFLGLSSFAAKPKKQNKIEIQGVVQKCHDGDTCRVLVKGQVAKVRFAGIDTPEINQLFGKEAKKFTEGLIKGKEVDLKCEGTSWDRITCTVFIEERNINQEIVQNGWAFDSTKFSKGAYKQAELEAKAKRLGIWQFGDLTSPYCFRHKTNKKCRIQPDFMP